MSMTDPIADLLVRIKNAAAVGKQTVKLPSSKIKVAIAQVLKDEGYITDLRVTATENNKSELEIVLKYFEGRPVIETLETFLALGSAPVPWQDRTAQGPGWPGYRHHLHVEGHHDRCAGSRSRRWW